MGNNPTKPSTPTPGQDSPRPAPRGQNRHPHPVHNQRVAAPPEPSLHQAQGSNAHSRPISKVYGSSPASSSTGGSKPTDIKPRPEESRTTEPSKPVAVPNSQSNDQTSPSSPFNDSVDTAAIMTQSSMTDISYSTRPPRMPLPIEEEIHTPGSPIIAPTDIGEPVDELDSLDADGLTRKSSTLSTTTVDEEDAEELRVDKNRPTVPTRLEWRRGGDKIYVTGTIFQWNRKHRLHQVEGRPGVYAATINILPGTHHVRFLVDGHMQTSPDLPTTVDFGNNLVNYIEVNPDDVPPELTEASGAPAADKSDQKAAVQPSPSQEEEKAKAPRGRDVVPASEFRYKIPKYLSDFDQAEESPAYQLAVTAIEKLPTPPSLPGFLAKPILNAAVLMKDDNSVLNMPNHTVLNHLATSSIKNNTLAVSATTRYKSKYVTTIIYKPTGQDEKD